MKKEDSLFIKILEYAYSKKEVGFIEDELLKEFDLKPEEIKWYVRVFRPANGNGVIEFLSDIAEKAGHRCVITAKGISTVLAYRGLKEAEVVGKRAERIARVSIWVGITVGVIQIAIGLFQLLNINP